MRTTGLLTIRPRRPDDDEFIRELAREAFGRWSRAPGQSIMAMLREPSSRALVAEADGSRIGFAVLSFEALGRSFGPWPRPVVASLDAIAVWPGARGCGVGRVLLGRAETLARDNGAVCMTLRTARTNAAAQALFGSAGFQATLEIPHFYRGGQSAFSMSKLLAD